MEVIGYLIVTNDVYSEELYKKQLSNNIYICGVLAGSAIVNYMNPSFAIEKHEPIIKKLTEDIYEYYFPVRKWKYHQNDTVKDFVDFWVGCRRYYLETQYDRYDYGPREFYKNHGTALREKFTYTI